VHPCLMTDAVRLPQSNIPQELDFIRVENWKELGSWLWLAGQEFGALSFEVFKLLLHNPRFSFLLGRLGEKSVCACLVYFDGYTAGIHHVAVHQSFRGKGYGKACFSAGIDWATSHHATQILALATEQSLPLWQSLGMRHIGDITLFWMPGEDRNPYFGFYGNSRHFK